MVNPKVTADEFAKRLGTVTAQELADGVITSAEDGASGIVLKVSARDWAYARIVLYHQITDKDVEYTIKKFEYVVKEFDRQLAWIDFERWLTIRCWTSHAMSFKYKIFSPKGKV